MSAEIICDACGARHTLIAGTDGRWYAPRKWNTWYKDDKILSACSKECTKNLGGVEFDAIPFSY